MKIQQQTLKFEVSPVLTVNEQKMGYLNCRQDGDQILLSSSRIDLGKRDTPERKMIDNCENNGMQEARI
jgi:hypothetical protein